jgi:uncharacterized membrane protein YdbT with pleckstrin-like domain
MVSYIDGNLLPGEQVVFRTRVHWKILVGPLLFAVVTFLPVVWLLTQGTWNNLVLIAPGLGLLVFLAALVRRQSSDFAVTNKRVMMKVGVFSTRSVELLLGKVEAITVHQSLGGRIFGYGDIIVTGSGGTEEAFSSIQSPLELRRAVQSVTDARTNADTRDHSANA